MYQDKMKKNDFETRINLKFPLISQKKNIINALNP